MTDTKEVAKKVTGGILSLTIIASMVAGKGVIITEGFAKEFLCGADNLAKQFTGNGLDIGVGKKALESSEKAFEWRADNLIKVQEKARGLLK